MDRPAASLELKRRPDVATRQRFRHHRSRDLGWIVRLRAFWNILVCAAVSNWRPSRCEEQQAAAAANFGSNAAARRPRFLSATVWNANAGQGAHSASQHSLRSTASRSVGSREPLRGRATAAFQSCFTSARRAALRSFGIRHGSRQRSPSRRVALQTRGFRPLRNPSTSNIGIHG